MDAVPQQTLVSALGVGARECVALVGAGGKTTTLRRLATELADAGGRVIVTTTTAMFLHELAAVAPVHLQAEGSMWTMGLAEALSGARAVGVARAEDVEGKVVGLTPAEVDGLWASGAADYVIVEADGSRGLPFKAFGPDEPQIPAAAGLVVVLAGLDALGAPLLEGHVHRAERLASMLGVPLGAEVTPRLLADGLRAQVTQVRRAHPHGHCLVLLNKADSSELRAAGRAVARDLRGRHPSGAGSGGEAGRPASVILASLRGTHSRIEVQR